MNERNRTTSYVLAHKESHRKQLTHLHEKVHIGTTRVLVGLENVARQGGLATHESLLGRFQVIEFAGEGEDHDGSVGQQPPVHKVHEVACADGPNLEKLKKNHHLHKKNTQHKSANCKICEHAV